MIESSPGGGEEEINRTQEVQSVGHQLRLANLVGGRALAEPSRHRR